MPSGSNVFAAAEASPSARIVNAPMSELKRPFPEEVEPFAIPTDAAKMLK